LDGIRVIRAVSYLPFAMVLLYLFLA